MKKFLAIILIAVAAGLIGFFALKDNTNKTETGKIHITTDINKNMELYKNTPNAILVDVRTKDEYESGYIEDSINVPLDEIGSADFNKEGIIFVYCKAGMRAQKAADILNAKGYEAYNIGGIDDYNGITVR